MPYDYAVLDNGQASNSKKPRSAKVKYVRAYLKSKGMKPTKDAASRSTRERKLRAKAREEFAKKSKPSGTSSTSKPSTAGQGRGAGTTRKGGAPAKPYGKYPSKSASGDSWKRGSMPKGK